MRHLDESVASEPMEISKRVPTTLHPTFDNREIGILFDILREVEAVYINHVSRSIVIDLSLPNQVALGKLINKVRYLASRGAHS